MPSINDDLRPHIPPNQPTEADRAARAAIMRIRLYPDLEVALRRALDFGPHTAMLQHLVFWFHPRHPKMQDRWTLYKTFGEWRDECGLSERQVYKGRKKLRELGLVTEKRGPHGRIHYRVDWVALAKMLRFDTVGVEPNTGDYEQESSRLQRAGEPAFAEPPAHARDRENAQEQDHDEARVSPDKRHSQDGETRRETAAETGPPPKPSDPAPPIPPDEALLERVRAILAPESGEWWAAGEIDRQLARYRPELVVENMMKDPDLPDESVREANPAELLPAVAYALWERRERVRGEEAVA